MSLRNNFSQKLLVNILPKELYTKSTRFRCSTWRLLTKHPRWCERAAQFKMWSIARISKALLQTPPRRSLPSKVALALTNTATQFRLSQTFTETAAPRTRFSVCLRPLEETPAASICAAELRSLSFCAEQRILRSILTGVYQFGARMNHMKTWR